jgi:hypothetical protein
MWESRARSSGPCVSDSQPTSPLLRAEGSVWKVFDRCTAVRVLRTSCGVCAQELSTAQIQGSMCTFVYMPHEASCMATFATPSAEFQMTSASLPAVRRVMLTIRIYYGMENRCMQTLRSLRCNLHSLKHLIQQFFDSASAVIRTNAVHYLREDILTPKVAAIDCG